MTCQRCGQVWDGKGAPPACISEDCPLRQQFLAPKLSGGQLLQSGEQQRLLCKGEHGSEIALGVSSTAEFYVSDAEPYNLKGAQSAKSVARRGSVVISQKGTTDTMHSEMMVIDDMLNRGDWRLVDGCVRWADGSVVQGDDFETDAPHCGFCSFFLQVMELPLTTPSFGNHKLASRLSYILPPAVECDVQVLLRVLSIGGDGEAKLLKRMLNAFVKVDAANWVLMIGQRLYSDTGTVLLANLNGRQVIPWTAITAEPKRSTAYAIWKLVFEQIFLHNKQKEHGWI